LQIFITCTRESANKFNKASSISKCLKVIVGVTTMLNSQGPRFAMWSIVVYLTSGLFWI